MGGARRHRPLLVVSALRLGRAIETRLAKRLQPLGLRPGQLSILMELEAGEDIALRQLAARIGLDPAAFARQIDALEDLGIVERAAHSSDARRRRLLLTGRGRQVLRRAAAAAAELERDLLAELQPKDRAAVIGALAELQHHAAAL
jgi:DNA-binding MarR family transcriptional regulator